jgi:hypothetical protein
MVFYSLDYFLSNFERRKTYPQSGAEGKLTLHIPRLQGHGRPQGLIRLRQKQNLAKRLVDDYPQGQESLKNKLSLGG